MFPRFTERDREQFDLIRRSPQFAQIAQRAFQERLERRGALVNASARRQAELRKRIHAVELNAAAAQGRFKTAEEERREAQHVLNVALMQGHAAEVALEVEISDLHAALHAEDDPRIVEIYLAADNLENLVRMKLEVSPHQSNFAEVELARAQIAAVIADLLGLSRGVYPANLLEIFDAQVQQLRKIATSFQIPDLEQAFRDIEGRSDDGTQRAQDAGKLMAASESRRSK